MGRIEDLPRRNWRETADPEFWTERLRTPNGTQTLRPIQAAALGEGSQVGGLVLNGRVGCGKRHVSLLLPEAMGAERALLLVPGAEAKEVESKILPSIRQHWRVPRSLRIRSYQFLGQPEREDWLWRHPPDLIIADEGHALKDLKNSSVARRVYRFLQEHPHVRFCVMTGTFTPHGDLGDYAHLLISALRKRAPIPLDPRGIAQWRRSLEGTSSPHHILGAHSHEQALDLFAHRLAETPGVIISVDSFNDVPLNVEYRLHDAPERTREAFQTLRDVWEAPDGWSYGDDRFQVAATARQFANGFYYRHDPRPPDWFLQKRKAWTLHCKTQIDLGFSDSEGTVKLKIINGHTTEGAKELEEWIEAEAAFPLRTVADWLAPDALVYARDWAKRIGHGGIIWVSHIEVGEALEQFTGLPFFHGQPRRNILNEDGSRCIIASIEHAGTGKNLQGPFVRGERAGPFFHNLILNPPANGEAIEQLIGRTHREEQVNPVNVEFYIACREHRQAVIKSIVAAGKITATLNPQKMANEPFPPNSTQDHPAWQKAKRRDDE